MCTLGSLGGTLVGSVRRGAASGFRVHPRILGGNTGQYAIRVHLARLSVYPSQGVTCANSAGSNLPR